MSPSRKRQRRKRRTLVPPARPPHPPRPVARAARRAARRPLPRRRAARRRFLTKWIGSQGCKRGIRRTSGTRKRSFGVLEFGHDACTFWTLSTNAGAYAVVFGSYAGLSGFGYCDSYAIAIHCVVR